MILLAKLVARQRLKVRSTVISLVMVGPVGLARPMGVKQKLCYKYLSSHQGTKAFHCIHAVK